MHKQIERILIYRRKCLIGKWYLVLCTILALSSSLLVLNSSKPFSTQLILTRTPQLPYKREITHCQLFDHVHLGKEVALRKSLVLPFCTAVITFYHATIVILPDCFTILQVIIHTGSDPFRHPIRRLTIQVQWSECQQWAQLVLRMAYDHRPIASYGGGGSVSNCLHTEAAQQLRNHHTKCRKL